MQSTAKIKFLNSSGVLILLVLLASCSKVHLWPEPGQEVDPTIIETKVEVTCQVDIDIQTVITRGNIADRSDIDLYQRRFLVNIYETGSGHDTLVFSDTFLRDVGLEDRYLSFTTTLQARRYNIVVWMDFIRKDAGNDLYYNTQKGFNAIHVRPVEEYQANDDFKDAQTFFHPVDLTTVTEWFTNIVIEVPLQRPLAKITFVTTDFQEYARKIGCPDDKISELTQDYEIRMSYNGYLPTGFNALTQKLNDSEVGYHYTSVPSWRADENVAQLGFDYVFVNGEQSSVNMSVEVVRKSDGAVVNRVDNITVPIYRGKETVVKDKFFTREYTPGIGINPEFDGEFNVYV